MNCWRDSLLLLILFYFAKVISMSLTKKTQSIADLIKAKTSAAEISGNEAIVNAEGAYSDSLEAAGIDYETVQKVLEHDKRFIVAATHVAGNIAEEQFSSNEEVGSVILTAGIDEHHAHTVRVQKMHEPVEGKPSYGLVQVHSAFGMNEESSEEFRKVTKAISKNIKALAG